MSNKTILFADDSATMRQIVEKTFAAEPYTVICVPSGEGAVTTAREVKPDVIIVDAGMPGVSGYDVCSAVRNDAAIQHTPVVIMSGVSSLYDESRGRSAGVTEHVKKPFDTGLLIEMVGNLSAAPIPVQEDVALEDEEPEDLPLEPISEPPLPEPELETLSEPPIPLTADAVRASAAGPDAASEEGKEPVGKQTRDYARPSSPPIDVHVGDPIPLEEEDAYGEEVDFGDDEDEFPEPEAPSDVPPIEIEPAREDAGSGSFHVGTLAELAQMDARGAPLESEPHDEAIELSPASSLASLGPKMAPSSGETSDAALESISDIPELPDTDDALEELPDVDAVDEKADVHVGPMEPSIPAASPYASVPAASEVRERADEAARQIADKVEGITPAQAAAIQTLTREIIERVVWEVVPDLAEVIIKEELAKLLKE